MFMKNLKRQIDAFLLYYYILLRSLHEEVYGQEEVSHLFITLVLLIITYVLSVYGASKPELTKIVIMTCYKRRYISKELSGH